MSDAVTSPDESCTIDTCSLDFAYSSYQPTFLGNLVYAIVFGVCLIAQLLYGLRARSRTLAFTACLSAGLVLEIAGYTGRMLMHYNPFKQGSFLLYLVPLTIGPAFFSAGIYLCLGRIVTLYRSERDGADVGRLRPRTYTIIFVACDFVSLLLQATGGAVASMADTKSVESMGINIMIAGLAFQVASMALFITLAAEIAWRVRKVGAGKDAGDVSGTPVFKRFLIALTVATICIFIRCIFRVAELSGGFNGELANNQATFMVLEGLMMVIAAIALTVYHPGRSFQGKWAQMKSSFRKGDGATSTTEEVENKA